MFHSEEVTRPCENCAAQCSALVPMDSAIARVGCARCGHMNYLSRVERIDIGLSEVCNLTCNMCRRPQEREAIPRAKVLQIITEARSIGVSVLSFSGGEPFIYPSFRECLTYALDVGLSVEIVTNGTMIRDSDVPMLERTKCVTVSIDGPEVEHDFIRGQVGCWRKTMQTISRLAGSHVTWGTNTVMQGSNCHVLYDSWREIRKRGRPSYIGFSHVEVVPETAHLQMTTDQAAQAKQSVKRVREECALEGIYVNDDCMQDRGCFAMFNDKSRRYRPVGGCSIPQAFIGISAYGFFPCWHQGRAIAAASLIEALESPLCSDIIREALERRCIGCNSANYAWSEQWKVGMIEAFSAGDYDVGIVHLSENERMLGRIRDGNKTLPLLERLSKGEPRDL